MSDKHEMAEQVRIIVASATDDQIDTFLAQVSRSNVAECLIRDMPKEARIRFLMAMVEKYSEELGPAVEALMALHN